MNLEEEERRKRAILDKLSSGPMRWNPTVIDDSQLEKQKMRGSGFEDIREDPTYASAQRDTLSRFGEIADKGYTVSEEAAMQRARSEANRDDASRRAAILQQMNMRGGGGGGAALAAQLASADSAAERESQAAADALAQGQQRSLSALQQRGAMARGMSQDEYTKQARSAQARDEMQRFNSGLTQAFQQNNMQAKNQAGQYNAGAANNWAMDTGKMNYDDAVQSQNRKIAEDAERKKAKAKRQSGIGSALGGIAGGIIGTTIAPGLGTAAGASAGAAVGQGLGDYFSDERMKKNVKPIEEMDIDEFMAALGPKKYKYKNDDIDQPMRLGVMAQDLEGSELGDDIVSDTDDGKMLDTQNLMGAILAAIKRLDNKKADREG